MTQRAEPLFANLQYCVRCCIPDTEEGTTFDELGICQACRSSEEKMHIDWAERERALVEILDWAKEKAGDNYDCIVPISGGKDSTFQLHVMVKVYGMKALAVTFSHNWYSETGWYNLVNTLEQFQVDHIMFTPNRGLVNKLAKKSLYAIGDPCWTCHTGPGNFPLQIAVKFKIPLLVYGEPAAEGHGSSSYTKPIKYDRDYWLKVSGRVSPEQMVDEEVSRKDLRGYFTPSQQELDEAGVRMIQLGSYVFWDDERQTEFVRDTYGWRETQMENTYKGYKSAECIMPGMHDFTWYLKRGFARGTSQATLDVRNGMLTREEGFALARKHDTQRPEALDYFLKITGMTENEFYEAMRAHRLPQLKDVEMPVTLKESPNREKIQPVVEQLIERIRSRDAHTYEADRSLRVSRDGKAERDTFLDLSVSRILQGYGDKEFSPVEIADLCIEQVQRLESKYEAWVSFDADRLREKAREAEAQIAYPDSYRPLEAIPVGVKDIFNTTDFPTRMGSPLWEEFTPGNDARVVFNTLRAGGIVAGKTVTAEFAVHTLGKTLNPHDTSRTPGTSSSGSAVATALGMVPVALGTQTAGSIVRPASFSGVYGCKPSFGLIPRTGGLKTTDSLDTIGFFVTHFEDIERVFDALRVHGPDYPISHAALNDMSRQGKPSDRPWRVALARTHTWEHAAPYAKDALLDWARKLAEVEDVEVIEVDLPAVMDRSHEVHSTVYSRSLANYFQAEFERSELVSPIMNDLIRAGLEIGPDAYEEALRDQEKLAHAMDDLLQGYDVMVSLSTAGEAPPREETERPDPALIWTMTHLPVISAPVFTSPSGLPFGAQLVARRYNDPLLFKFADHLRGLDLIPEGPNPRIGTRSD